MWLERLTAIKKESGKTLKQISEESGVPIGTLNKLFAGQTKDPKLDTVRSVVHALGHTLDDLTDDPPQRTKKSPSATEAAPGDAVLSMFDKLNDLLISDGFIKEDEDLTDWQADIILAICRIISATFQG